MSDTNTDRLPWDVIMEYMPTITKRAKLLARRSCRPDNWEDVAHDIALDLHLTFPVAKMRAADNPHAYLTRSIYYSGLQFTTQTKQATAEMRTASLDHMMESGSAGAGFVDVDSDGRVHNWTWAHE